MFDAPEAAGGDGAFLRALGDGLGGPFGVEAEAGGGCERAEEAGEEVGHEAGHDERGYGEDESCGRELQRCGFMKNLGLKDEESCMGELFRQWMTSKLNDDRSAWHKWITPFYLN